MRTTAGLFDFLGLQYIVGGTHRNVRDGWIGVDCPWCGTVGKYHLGLPRDGGGWAACWVCGRHSLVEVLHALTQRSWDDCRQLAESVAHLAPAQWAPTHTRSQVELPPGLEDELRPAHQQYLRQRGLDPAQIVARWGVRGTGPAAGFLSWRLWLPVVQAGQLVSWTTRSISPRERMRYISARPEQERMPIKSTLYGEDLVRHAVVIVEGPVDVWRIGPGAVAVYGISWTEAQALRLERFLRRVICFDREPLAQAAAKRLAKRLCAAPGETLIVSLDAADPGAADEAELRQLRRLAFEGEGQ